MARTAHLQKLLNIRAKALQLVKQRGAWVQVGSTNLLIAKPGQLTVAYRTPFQRLPAEDETTWYECAFISGKANLPYGLEAWHSDKKVLNIEWDDEGGVEVLSYRPGEWELILSA